ncbi:hypothetical protein LCGC14_0146510 [marine sediment metagenome]|uniref:Uncharacterized protein n=1 Tax=marine sediment metagenome TaxID=412755 RepID=A0A0F9UZZ7_9ZZZZ
MNGNKTSISVRNRYGSGQVEDKVNIDFEGSGTDVTLYNNSSSSNVKFTVQMSRERASRLSQYLTNYLIKNPAIEKLDES